ncbi:hypothetical protein L0657_05630 [Dyadobacter sp. CY345]|uniref:hypothetical protein n=1 Tax=Dyadobacter sp. CY345 TaxID=2909335 RepID=UPI001F30088E|nr:hypothetical protein [Dyadobacter sp. CY345]MCF2443430.1 hypothetical protein [Dyadobacter sp. CY345]
MLTKIDNTIKYGKQHGGFGIQILYPGLICPVLAHTGYYTIVRNDHARMTPGLDSEGHSGIISNRKLMMMNSGAGFYHQEKVSEEGGISEGL